MITPYVCIILGVLFLLGSLDPKMKRGQVATGIIVSALLLVAAFSDLSLSENDTACIEHADLLDGKRVSR